MWIVPYLIETQSNAVWPTLASYRARRMLRSVTEPIATWWRREREQEELCRYTEYEFRDLPCELDAVARFECKKRFWKS